MKMRHDEDDSGLSNDGNCDDKDFGIVLPADQVGWFVKNMVMKRPHPWINGRGWGFQSESRNYPQAVCRM